MLLLAFDTATPAVTIAVCEATADGVRVRAEASSVDARRHGELLTPGIRDVTRQAGVGLTDLTHLAVGIGPGPYTGLRVGLATGHALAESLGIPCHGVATLDALAFASGRTTPFVAASDARRKEVFWARYEDSHARTGDIAVNRPADVVTSGLPVLGHGAAMYDNVFDQSAEAAEPLYPSGAALGAVAARRLAAGVALPEALPLYLRRPDAAVPSSPKKVRQWQT